MDGDITHLHGTSGAPRPGLDRAALTCPWDGVNHAGGEADASHAVTALYRTHALGLTRLAFVMLGDRPAAEDVVQEAFCGLYRSWDRLHDRDKSLAYLRVSVLNGCRSALRRRKRTPAAVHAVRSVGGSRRARGRGTARGGGRAAPLAPRQREALVLRYYADLPEYETALAMGVSRGTVKSTTARALAALGRMLREDQ